MIQSEKGKKKLAKAKMAAKSRRAKEKAILRQEEMVKDPLKDDKDGLLFITAKDLQLERKLVKNLAEHIEDNEFREMNKLVRKKLKKWTKVSMKIAVLGQGRSGKTSFIEALLGQKMSKQCKVVDQSLKLFEYRSPLNENLVVTEISLPETNRIRDDMVKEIDFTQFDCFVILTSTWFTETSMWITSYLKKLRGKIIFVRTKIDETIQIEQQKKSSSSESILSKVRGHCENTLKMNYSMAAKVHLFSAHFPSNWDGNHFVQNLIRFASDGRSKCPIAMSLNPMAPQVLSAKYELLNERIWKLAVMSVSSGIMPAPGFSIVADIELLKTEIVLYFLQFGIDERSLTGDLALVWKLIQSGEGLVSLLKQASLEQREEEFLKYLKWLPLIGGNVSFASTCSVLSFLLMEVFILATRMMDQKSLLPGENIPPRCQAIVIEPEPKEFKPVYL